MFRLGWFLIMSVLIPALASERATGQAGHHSPEEVYASAFDLYANRFYERAAEAFGSFRSAYPEHPLNPEALYYQAESALGAGLEDEATQLYIRFYERFPIHPLAFQARLALGHYFLEQERYDRAIDAFRSILNDDPDREIAAKAYYWMGDAAVRSGDLESGLAYYGNAADDYRETSSAPLALYAIAFAYSQADRPSEAARAFETLSGRYPESGLTGDIGLGLAESYYEIGEYDRALAEIERRLPDLTGDVEERATFLMAECYNHLEEHGEAIVYYRRFTERNPFSRYFLHALYGLAWNYHFARDYEAAAQTFERIYTGNAPEDLAVRSRYYHALNLKMTGRLSEAASLFSDVAERWPSHDLADQATFELGMTYYELRRWEDAERAFSQVQQSYPRSESLGEALRMAGEARVAQGDFEGAGRAYDAAIDLEAAPEELRKQVAFQKAWLSFRNEEYSEAAPAFQEIYRDEGSSDLAGDALFWAAESYYQLRDYRQAVQLYSRFLRQFRRHQLRDAAYYALGWTYFKLSSYSNAIRQFETFLDTYTETPGVSYGADARLRLADSYYAIKRYGAAIRQYDRIEGEQKDYALFQKGQAQAQSGQNRAAIRTLEELIDEFQLSDWREEALYSIGYLYLLEGNHEKAVSTFETLVSRFPEHPLAARAQYGIGDSFYNRSMWQDAVNAYRNVLVRFPESQYVVDAVGSMSYALAVLEKEDELDSVIDAFAARNPGSPFVDRLRFRQAEVRYQSGQLIPAIEAFQDFVRGAGSEALVPDAYMYIARAYEDLGQMRESAAYLEQLTDRYPASPLRAEAEQRLGAMLLEDERYQEALRHYREARRNEDADPLVLADARYGEGMALLGLGRIDEAEELLREEAASDDLNALPARLGMARIYERQGLIGEAIANYRDVAARSADDKGAEALCRLGELLLQLGDAEASLEELGRMEVLFPGYDNWMARGMVVQARAYNQLGENGSADRLYESVLQQYPDSRWAATAEQEREMLGGSP